MSVGNGEFAFTVDLTGLQSFPPNHYPPVGARDDLPPRERFWGGRSHSGAGTRFPHHSPTTSPAQPSSTIHPVARSPYVDMAGDIVNDRETDTSLAETWLRANVHRLDLGGRIGFRWVEDDVERHLMPADIADAEQTLDLWTGVVTSRFTLAGHPVTVTTACHPDRDELGIRVESPALAAGLVVGVDFPYGSEAWHDAADWKHPESHTTSLEARIARANTAVPRRGQPNGSWTIPATKWSSQVTS